MAGSDGGGGGIVWWSLDLRRLTSKDGANQHRLYLYRGSLCNLAKRLGLPRKSGAANNEDKGRASQVGKAVGQDRSARSSRLGRRSKEQNALLRDTPFKPMSSPKLRYKPGNGKQEEREEERPATTTGW